MKGYYQARTAGNNSISMAKKVTLCFSVFLLFQASHIQKAHGQTLDKDHAVFIGVNTGMAVIENSFTNEFRPSPAVRLNLRFPFLAGQIEGGVRFLRFNRHAHTQTDSDFRSFYIYAGYFYPFHITDWYAVGPALYVGYNLIYYNQAKVYTNKLGNFHYITDTVDGEYAYELSLRNQFRISRHWFINASLSYNHTYTKVPLPLTMVSMGISYAFSEPGWLKTFLR